MSVGAGQNGLVITGLERGDLGQRRVEVLPGRLGRRWDDVVVIAAPGRDGGPDARLAGVITQIGAPRPNRDHHLDRGRQRVQAHLAIPEIDQRPDVAGVDLVDRDRFLDRGNQFRLSVRRLHHVDLGAAIQPRNMIGQPEHGAAMRGGVGADALENTPTVVQGRVENVDAGIVPVDELTAHPDL